MVHAWKNMTLWILITLTLLGTITGLEKFIYKEQIYKQSQKSHVGWLQQTVGSNSI